MSSISASLPSGVSARLRMDPWDAGAWGLAVQHAASLESEEDAVGIFEACLRLFPRSLHVWREYAGYLQSKGSSKRAGQQLGRVLGEFAPDPGLWAFYVQFVRATQLAPLEAELKEASAEVEEGGVGAGEAIARKNALEEKVGAAREVVGKAFRAALAVCGMIPGAEDLWDGYVSFLDARPGDSELERNDRNTQVMEVLREAATMPLAGVEGRVEQFTARVHAVSGSDAAAAEAIKKSLTKSRAARFVASQRTALWKDLLTSPRFATPPTPPLSFALQQASSKAADDAETAAGGGERGKKGGGEGGDGEGGQGGEGGKGEGGDEEEEVWWLRVEGGGKAVSVKTVALHASVPLCPQSEGGMQNSKALATLVDRWRAVFAFEEANHLDLDPKALQTHLRRVYHLSLSALLRFPEPWVALSNMEQRLSASILRSSGEEGGGGGGGGGGGSGGSGGKKKVEAWVSALAQGVEACPGSQQLALECAHAYELVGDARKAMAAYEKAIDRCPGAPIFIQYLRFVRRAAKRSERDKALRKLFSQKIQSHPSCTPQVLVAMAQITASSSSSTPPSSTSSSSSSSSAVSEATKSLIDEGRRRFPGHLPMALAFADILARSGDEKNVRALFESLLGALSASGRESAVGGRPGGGGGAFGSETDRLARARAVWDRYLDFELRWACDAGVLRRVRELEVRRERALGMTSAAESGFPSAQGPIPPLQHRLHRFQEYGTLPCGPHDAEALSRHPFVACWFHGPDGERSILRPVGKEGGLGQLPPGMLPALDAPDKADTKGIRLEALSLQAKAALTKLGPAAREFLSLLPAPGDAPTKTHPRARAAEVEHAATLLATIKLDAATVGRKRSRHE